MSELLGLPLDGRFVAVVVAVFLGGFMRGFIGFAGALVIVPVMSMIYSPQAAVAIASLLGFPAIFQLLPEAVRHSERPVVFPISIAAFLATPLGSWVLASANPELMKIVIAVLMLIMVSALATGWQFKREPHRSMLIGTGVTSGLIQGAAGIGGPPVVLVVMARGGTPKQQRANVLGVLTVLSFAAFAPLIYFGLYTRQILTISLILVPIYIASTAFGSRYFDRGGQKHYRRAALGTLVLIAIATVLSAVKSYHGL